MYPNIFALVQTILSQLSAIIDDYWPLLQCRSNPLPQAAIACWVTVDLTSINPNMLLPAVPNTRWNKIQMDKGDIEPFIIYIVL
jgi:hypothetical protein